VKVKVFVPMQFSILVIVIGSPMGCRVSPQASDTVGSVILLAVAWLSQFTFSLVVTSLMVNVEGLLM
jgi:hypothetical protein